MYRMNSLPFGFGTSASERPSRELARRRLFRVDGKVGRDRDFLSAGCKCNGAFQAGRPRGCEQLLRVSTDARGTRGRQADVENAVRAARNAVFATTSGFNPRRVEDRYNIAHDVFFLM
jgi:hypothetical protein